MTSFRFLFIGLIFILFSTPAYPGDSIYIDSSGKVGIGTITPRDTLDVNGNVKVAGDVCTDNGNCLNTTSVPPGGIIMWSGTTIPDGWLLCDGTNGTPDLRDRFILGAGNTYAVGNTGGSNTISAANLPPHTHSKGSLKTASGGSHDHSGNINWYKYYLTSSTVTDWLSYPYIGDSINKKKDGTYQVKVLPDGNHSHSITGTTGSTGSGTNYMPKYYALAFIMKL